MASPKFKNLSPWLADLERQRPVQSIISGDESDVLVIGAGIAGVATAYFLLTKTRHAVIVVDASKVAHAATGHNAGQLVSYFERPFPEIIEEFGEELAVSGQKEVNQAWDLIAEIKADLDLKTMSWDFLGAAGLPNLETLIHHLTVANIFDRHNLPREDIFVAESFKDHHLIPQEYRRHYQVVPDYQLSALLQITGHEYIGALRGRKGCMNSAAFTEEIISKLLERYPKRLQVIEDLPVSTLHLHHESVTAATKAGNLRARYAVLCTNGFESITLNNHAGPEINTQFHHLVKGSVGYMAGYIQEPSTPPTAVSYLTGAAAAGTLEASPYVYMTRRPLEGNQAQSLVCLGGPEALYDDTNDYTIDHQYPTSAGLELDRFVEDRYATTQTVALKLAYRWHGLMGYTPNGIRLVGGEPHARALYYNLGCNGVGILPSIAGGLRIARLLNSELLPPSIFDPAASSGLVVSSSPWARFLRTIRRLTR